MMDLNVMRNQNLREKQNLMEKKNLNLRETIPNQKILNEINQVLIKLGSTLPPGWKLNEDSITVKNEIVCHTVDLPEYQDRYEKNEIEEEEFEMV